MTGISLGGGLKAAARPLVPAALEIPDRPVVTVSRMSYAGVDYLAGRGYNEVTVGITATHELDGGRFVRRRRWLGVGAQSLAGPRFLDQLRDCLHDGARGAE